MGTPEPIAIIGTGCRFPGNATTSSMLFDVLHSPRDLLASIPEERFSTRGFYHEKVQYHGHTNVQQSYLLSGEGSHRCFDAQFFGISPAEANVIDPQMRLLLETVYEALENAGQTIKGLQGSNTAVYAGLMTSDYEHIMSRDEDAMGTYHVTGTSRALMSNRISYFFDWHGPSMTIDTACSSSLYAVHHAVQQLSSGASRVAVAAGSNLLLDPVGYIAESKLQMLSPGSRSRMWDASADGYARGEGVAAIILKTLSAAEKDGDHVECIIRETAVNQDGRTKGITVPSAEAQANLIRNCYDRAGLDIYSPTGRPQYFEAHGTGTPSGDPIEAEAISGAFFDDNVTGTACPKPLLVGSIKTVMGHTEAVAGLAGILKASLALQHSVVLPNLLFNRLNPQIEPFYNNFHIPTTAMPWPCVPESSPRRASVNSFGFGGANAHAILESYSASSRKDSSYNGPVFCPFIFSAASEVSLIRYLEAICNYLKGKGTNVNMRDLAYTLHSRRTRFPFIATFSSSTAKQLASKIEQYVQKLKFDAGELLGVQAHTTLDCSKPRVLGVFTGQGAQWVRMGARLISESASARRVLDKLQARLARLPVDDRPSWFLAEELQKEATSSRVSEAELSQPLCTAIGILLVDTLREACVRLTAVVGFSSGEIAAAYAAGIISAEDAICIAYYCGLYAKLAQGPEGQAGTMLAVGTSADDIDELLQEPEFEGRACIAAVNSSASVTLSGDADAIKELSVVLKDEKKFTRLLKVDKAYHSHHMVPCSTSYLRSLQTLNIQVHTTSQCVWFSSVYEDGVANLASSLKGPYWDSNMLNPVRFKQAIERACLEAGPFDLAIEVGPHPALKGPAMQVIKDITSKSIPYTSLLQRGIDDLEAVASGLGYASKHTGEGFVDFQSYDAFMSGAAIPEIVKTLPPYCWNHKEYWHESRYSRAVRRRSDDVHELLGHLSPDSTERDMRWRHLLRPKEMPWLRGHQLQNRIVFPAAGYVVAALEASNAMLQGDSASIIKVTNLEIGQALTFDKADSSVETMFSVTDIDRNGNKDITAKFTYNAATGKKGDVLDVLASGSICIRLCGPSPTALPARSARPPNFIRLKADDFYNALAKLEYQYSDDFVALSGLERKLGAATGFISNVEGSQLLVHPAMLDAAFQSVLLTASAPGDGSLWSMHVPRRIESVAINPELCMSEMSRGKRLAFDAFQPSGASTIAGDVDIFPEGLRHAMIQIEGLECVPFAPPTAKDDKVLFSSTIWGNAFPNAVDVTYDGLKTSQQYDLACILERMACFYLREFNRDVPLDHKSRRQGPYTSFFKFASHTLARAKRLGRPFWEPKWENDSFETIAMVSAACKDIIDVRLLHTIGQRLAGIVMNETPAIEISMKDNLLAQYYQDALGMQEYTQYLARTAVDDRVAFIRDPLSSSSTASSPGTVIQDLILLGGSSLKVSKLKALLEPLLQQFCSSMKTFTTLADMQSFEIPSGTTVLSLVDLDRPVFSDPDETSWNVMKSMFQEAGAVLWVTQGRRAANPYANMTIGLLRSAINEIPGLEVQFLDVEDPERLDARTVGEALLRFKAVVDWKQGDHREFEENAFVTVERELVIEKGGRLVIPRIMPDKELNERYNSSRHPIYDLTDTSEHVVSLVATVRGHVLQREPEILAGSKSTAPIERITHSLLAPIRVAGHGQLFLALGIFRESQARFIALSTKNTSAMSHNTFLAFPVAVASGSEASFLYLVSLLNLTSQIIQGVEAGDRVLVHEPTPEMMAIIRDKAQARGISVTFTTSRNDGSPACIPIHPNSPKRVLQSLNLGSITVFLDLGNTNESRHVAGRIRSQLSALCRCETIHADVREDGRAPSSAYASKVRSQLYDNIVDAGNELSKFLRLDQQYKVIRPGDISEYDHLLAPQSIVDWSMENKVSTKVLPIDSHDITKRNEVVALYTEISSTLPIIGGVAQGAMVLHDTAISEMSLETFQKVTQPKVEGSIHLNSLFQQDTLDFFVFFSSVSVVIGTPGQSAYVAANMFMVSLAEQRRRRGLAASAINIGPIIGAGYIAQQQISIATVKRPLAYMNMSEQDFHQLFAEAIVAGRPHSTSSIEITSGVRGVRMDEETQPIWASNPLMSHYILNGESVDNTPAGRGSREPLKMQLLHAQNHVAVRRLIEDALLEKLGILLQLDVGTMDRDRLETIRLDELGLDSLMATEIRAWLLKNLQVNYPVLKILSGISVLELVEAAVNGIPPVMIPDVETSHESRSAVIAQTTGTQSTSASDSLLLETATAHRSSDEIASTSDSSELAVDMHVPTSSKPVVLTSVGLSSNQSMFWFVSQLFENRASLNFVGSCRISGPLNIPGLERATKALGQQHEALRTCFNASNGHVVQGVMEASIIRLEHREILDDEAMATAIVRTSEEVQKHHYDLDRGETLRLIVLSSSSTRHGLILGTSHLCMDGLSIQILLTDLFRHYNKELGSQDTFQYRDYVQSQKQDLDSGEFEKEFRFWEAQYPEFPPPLPILRVSRAKARPSLTTFNDDKVETRISFGTKSQIQTVCRNCRVTPFHFYLACYRALLSRYADTRDVSIGIGDANRSEDRMMSGIGVFNNVLPLRFRTNVSSKFEDVLQETRNIAYAGLKNSRVPFQALLERLDPPRSATHTPIFQCSLNYRQGQRKKEVWGDCELELLSIDISKTGYDLALDINDDQKGDCLVTLIIRSDLYQKSEAEILVKSYEKLVRAFAAESNAVLNQPGMYEHADTIMAMHFSRGQPRTTQWGETVIHRIDHISRTLPDAIAIQGSSESVTTYAEPTKLSSSIATNLTASGAVGGSRIATLQAPTVRWIASILAIMRIGAVYVPLDLSMPRARLATIVRDCEPDLVLLDDATKLEIHELRRPEMLPINVSELDPAKQPSPISATASDHAMILYTSGSSGAPKGVILKHEGIRNWIEPAQELYCLVAETVLQQSACTFDMSFEQMLFALCFGGSLYLPPRSLRGDAYAITDLIAQKGITFTVATPTEYSSWLTYRHNNLLSGSKWRVALSGGEPVTNSLLAQFRDLHKPDLHFFNSYGPTETTVTATSMEIRYEDDVSHCDSIAAGFVLPNYSVYVVSEHFNLVPPEVQGEIYIGGPGVAAHYLNDPTLTAEKFVPDVFAANETKAKGWTMMHRSGDLGRWRKDGALLIEGRISGDTQIKLRGIRVDLREIEDAMLKAAGGSLSDAVVSIRRSTSESHEFLIAHVVFDSLHPEEGRAELLRSLPASLPLPKHMCPVAVIPLRQMPRTSSSKLDRKAICALPLQEMTTHEEERYNDELTETEKRLRDIWVAVIQGQFKNSRPIMPDTDFFHIGGTSLLLLGLQAEIREIFGANLPVINLLEASTLGTMARLIKNEAGPSETINWEEETRPNPAILGLIETTREMSRDWSVVVLTGSTGFLGRAILGALIAEDKVEKVHCIGIRGVSSRKDITRHDKVHLHEGDLTLPRLGLTENDACSIFSKAGCIIHSGAQVSHSQSYRSLRLPNLQSTKELVEMCLPYRTPLHYVSTTQVGAYYSENTGRREFPEVSVAAFKPPQAGFEGYPASKWASECFLERLHQKFAAGDASWPIFVHRPTMISRAVDDPERDVIHSIRQFSTRMAAVPVMPNYQGFLDTVALQDVVFGIMDAVKGADGTKPGVQFRHYFGKEVLSCDDPISAILLDTGDRGGPVEELPPLEWARRAGELGLHPHVVKWVESAAVQREQVFPKVIHGDLAE
ncbi:hypothetical protein DL766_009227 [Monosporascus sp. MC13-8B]|nr:hypothetical protein DL766_009227 [Monosporascus sp. MC13-8B]